MNLRTDSGVPIRSTAAALPRPRAWRAGERPMRCPIDLVIAQAAITIVASKPRRCAPSVVACAAALVAAEAGNLSARSSLSRSKAERVDVSPFHGRCTRASRVPAVVGGARGVGSSRREAATAAVLARAIAIGGAHRW